MVGWREMKRINLHVHQGLVRGEAIRFIRFTRAHSFHHGDWVK
jgi:hypothetical protein